MADIFISYKSERRAAAFHLKEVLECYFCGGDEGEGPDVVWYDYGLIPGKDFEPRIMEELGRAKAVVVLWCKKATESEWVNREAEYARTSDKYVPCWIEACALPKQFEGADTINLIEWDGAPRSHMLDRLLERVGELIGREVVGRHNRLKALDQRWRHYGAPSMRQFAPSSDLEAIGSARSAVNVVVEPSKGSLGQPPVGITPNLKAHWDRALVGDLAALCFVANCYLEGSNGLPKDASLAVRLCKRAAEESFVEAQAALGLAYFHGAGVEADWAEAAMWHRLAAGQGHALSQHNLGALYELGFAGYAGSGAPDAVPLYRSAANQGFAASQNRLGEMLSNGEGGLRTNEAEALKLFTLAADQEFPLAQLNLGIMHEFGKAGLAKDEKQAAIWYRKAAEQGLVQAQFRLANMYRHGRGGLRQDDKEAARLFGLAAQQGHAQSQANLGAFYAEGRGGLPLDENEAARWFQIAARQGDVGAQVNLGMFYVLGKGGLRVDTAEARRLWTLAASQGNELAQRYLERLDRDGR